MADDENGGSKSVTRRECNLRHKPMDSFMGDLNKRQDKFTWLLLTTMVLIIINLVIALTLR